MTSLLEKPLEGRLEGRAFAGLGAASIVALSLLLIVAFVTMKFVWPDAYAHIIQEDALLENVQALGYLAAGIVALAAGLFLGRSGHRLLALAHYALCIGLVVVCFEEASWGQRAFGFATGEWFERHNVQNEVSLHNLSRVQPLLHGVYIAVGLYGGLAWLLLPRRALSGGDWRRFCIAEPGCTFWFLPVAFVYVLLECAKPEGAGGTLTWRDQEPAETMLALGFLAVAVANLAKARALPRNDAPR